MRNLKLTEWIAVFAALLVVSIFVFPSWFGGIFFPSNASPEGQNVATAAALNASSTPSTTNTNANMQNISTVPGLMAYDTTVGTGTPAVSGSQVTVNYIGTLSDGTVFDQLVFARYKPLPLLSARDKLSRVGTRVLSA